MGRAAVKLLLDTHIWLWSELEPTRLPAGAARAMATAENELWLSPLSAWELALLHGKRRVELDRPWAEWLAASLEGQRYREATLSFGVVREAAAIRLPQRDPIDRLLAATARHYGLRLVTADAQLLAGHGFDALHF